MRRSLLIAGFFLGLAQLQFGQQVDSNIPNLENADTGTPSAGNTSDNVVNDKEGMLSRWLDINQFTASLRYRSTENSGGFHTFEFGQHREILDGRLKLDKEGKYSINFHASSGRYFNWAFADMLNGQFTDGVPRAGKYRPFSETLLIIQALKVDPTSPYPKGIESRGGYIYFRQLYFSATPIKQVTFDYGSLPIEHGENTEITSFDDDGYLSGARVRVHDPEQLFFSEINGTWGYLGSALTPNFFARGNDLTRIDYQQYMARKKMGRTVASVDYTRLLTTNTFREAFRVKTPELHIIDYARTELYQRTNITTLFGIHYGAGSGFGFTGSKNLLNKRLLLEGGYAHVDQYYSVYTGDPFLIAVGFSWNGDAFMTGSKAFTRGNLKVAPGLSLFGFFSHEVSPYTFFITNHATVNGGITLDMDELMHRAHLL